MDELALDSVSAEVRRNWNALQAADYNPIPVALELLQRSNPSHDPGQFTVLHDRLQAEMLHVVDTHYGAFNDSIGTFGAVVDRVNATRKLLGALRGQVQTLRDQLEFRKTDLHQAWQQLQTVRVQTTSRRQLADQQAHIRRVLDVLASSSSLSSSLQSSSSLQASLSVSEDNIRRAMRLASEFDVLKEERVKRALLQAIYQGISASLEALNLEDLARFAQLGDDLSLDYGDLSVTSAVQAVIQRLGQQCALTADHSTRVRQDLRWLVPDKSALDVASYGESVQELFAELSRIFGDVLRRCERSAALHKSIGSAISAELTALVEGMVQAGGYLPGAKPRSLLQVPHPTVALTKILEGRPKPAAKGDSAPVRDFFDDAVSPAFVFEHPELSPEIEAILTKSALVQESSFPYRQIANPRQTLLVDVPWGSGNAQYLLYLFGPLRELSKSLNEREGTGELDRRLTDLGGKHLGTLLERYVLNDLIGRAISPPDAFAGNGAFQAFTDGLCRLVYVKHRAAGFVHVESLMVRLVEAFLARLDGQIKAITVSIKPALNARPGHSSEIDSLVVISLVMAQSATLRALYASHPLVRCALQIGASTSSPLSSSVPLLTEQDFLVSRALSEQESLHISRIKRDRSLHPREILTNVDHLRLLARLQAGLKKLLVQLDGNDPDSFPVEFIVDDEAPDRLQAALHHCSPVGFVDFSEAAFCGYSLIQWEMVIYGVGGSKFQTLLKVAQDWSRTLLYMLRLEIRMHCYYYLELAFREVPPNIHPLLIPCVTDDGVLGDVLWTGGREGGPLCGAPVCQFAADARLPG
jgi:hypothetical protein